MQEMDGIAKTQRRVARENHARTLEMARKFRIVDVVEVAQTLVPNQVAVNERTIRQIHLALLPVRQPFGENVGKAQALLGNGGDEVERNVAESRRLQMRRKTLEEIVGDARREAGHQNIPTRTQRYRGVHAKFAWRQGEGKEEGGERKKAERGRESREERREEVEERNE